MIFGHSTVLSRWKENWTRPLLIYETTLIDPPIYVPNCLSYLCDWHAWCYLIGSPWKEASWSRLVPRQLSSAPSCSRISNKLYIHGNVHVLLVDFWHVFRFSKALLAIEYPMCCIRNPQRGAAPQQERYVRVTHCELLWADASEVHKRQMYMNIRMFRFHPHLLPLRPHNDQYNQWRGPPVEGFVGAKTS